MYQAWKSEVASRGNVEFKLNHEVIRVVSRTAKKNGPVQVEYKIAVGDLETAPQVDAFDELILAVDADAALKLLGKEATWIERRILGSVKYLYDVTITHNDLDYMKKVSYVSPSSSRK